MQWSESEIENLSPILEQVLADLEPLNGKKTLVLCSGAGQIALWLAKRATQARILGVELDDGLLAAARLSAEEKGLSHFVEFRKAEKTRLGFPDNTFDRLVSEFIIFPTPAPTQIGQPEMARVLRPGGKMVITAPGCRRPV